MARPRKDESPVVAVNDAVSDGKGGFFAKGEKLPALPEDIVESLRAKGLVE